MSDVSLDLMSYRGIIAVDCKKSLPRFREVLVGVTSTLTCQSAWLTMLQPGPYLLADLARANWVSNL